MPALRGVGPTLKSEPYLPVKNMLPSEKVEIEGFTMLELPGFVVCCVRLLAVPSAVAKRSRSASLVPDEYCCVPHFTCSVCISTTASPVVGSTVTAARASVPSHSDSH